MCLHPVALNKLKSRLWRWRGISAACAINLLVRTDCGEDVMDWDRAEKCPYDMAKSHWFENMRAREVGLFRFMGGPPGQRRLLTGDLLMFLVDRMMYREAMAECVRD